MASSLLQGRTPMFDDLRTLDPELHRSLLMVKNYEGDVSDLGLTFSTTDDFFGLTTQHALLPGHGNTPVTNENRLLYCHLLADWHLNVRLGRPAEAFARGLAQLIPTTTLRLFNPKEFNQLVSGDSEEGGGGVDVDDLRRHTKYGGGYRPDSSAVELFWKVVSEFSPNERGLLLKFVTSCSRAPLGGFKYLHPPFLIHKVECEASFFASLPGMRGDVDRLPTASTCYNTLKLPNYRRKDTMRKKLLHAITSNAGFELS
ncbi:hypothetical protein DUNSADRAFT_17621 [Dunaliella salina]|uniref:HECT-type E3 ubiquitin transferase n=1 Tax=Dunaliella salina TaxID=3046 RepID=A0ABQ7GZV3_DUNSA|nr:hypothetical protein DUNSADRAFT_17621 [Dunaliella salina]|eukprot:KAF5840138.1 hypothetical protein DUNSADRAFT_17621 [Dunaliella salina]